MDVSRFILEFAKKKRLDWLERRYLDLISPLNQFLANILKGRAVLILSDDEREWYIDYIINKINDFKSFKPTLIPIFNLYSIVPQIKYAKTQAHFNMIEDMLGIAFKDDYTFWYIGKEDFLFDFVKDKETFFWVFDKDFQDNFYLNSMDENLDRKLIDLIELVKEGIIGAILGEISV
ncbi:MAG: HobA family DNA replication regulator [Nautiliaceae bacterium]